MLKQCPGRWAGDLRTHTDVRLALKCLDFTGYISHVSSIEMIQFASRMAIYVSVLRQFQRTIYHLPAKPAISDELCIKTHVSSCLSQTFAKLFQVT
jgi:hypothetical protein